MRVNRSMRRSNSYALDGFACPGGQEVALKSTSDLLWYPKSYRRKGMSIWVPEGEQLWPTTLWQNLVPKQGLDDALDKHLKGSSYTAAWYVGLIDDVAAGTLASNPIAATNTDATVTVTDTAHGLEVGDEVIFAGSTTVGGLDVNGFWIVATATTNSYTFEHTSTASSTASGGGASVTYIYITSDDTAAAITTGASGANQWGELTAYTESNRPTLTLGSVSGQSVDNSASKAVFTMNATNIVKGSLVVSTNTKAGTTGILAGAGAYAAERTVENGTVLNVTVTTTQASGT